MIPTDGQRKKLTGEKGADAIFGMNMDLSDKTFSLTKNEENEDFQYDQLILLKKNVTRK